MNFLLLIFDLFKIYALGWLVSFVLIFFLNRLYDETMIGLYSKCDTEESSELSLLSWIMVMLEIYIFLVILFRKLKLKERFKAIGDWYIGI